jgi:hypothetical protein
VKAISIRQPWAWGILHAGKDIENRSWEWNYRGPFAIHAPATLDPFDHRWPRGVARPDPKTLTLRAIVGVVDIVDVVQRSSSPWWLRGQLGWVLANPRPLPRPIPYKLGNSAVWTVPPAIVRQIRSQLGPRQTAAIASRLLTVTQGNLDNKHLYLTKALDLFPDDVFGGADARRAAPRTVRVQWGKEEVETDIDRAKRLFRKRGWVGRFFSENRIQAGDRVLLEQIEPYLYRVSRASTSIS